MKKSRFQSKRLDGVVPYTWGLQIHDKNIIKLNTNENPYPVSPHALTIFEDVKASQLSKYPDPAGCVLKAAIAEYYDVTQEEIFLGNGSDDVLSHCFLAFFDTDDSIKIPEFTYGLYSILADLYKTRCQKIALNADLTLNMNDYCQNTTAILIANPNAPTGIYLNRKKVIQIIESNPDQLVILDEAYIDFSPESMVDLIKNYDNVLFIQTLSKSRSLAGLRIGMAIGNPSLIASLHRVRDCINPYNVDALSLSVGAAAFKDTVHFQNTIEKIKDTRLQTTQALVALGCTVIPSDANFILVKHKKISSSVLYEALKEVDILVRYFDLKQHGSYIRISIGLPSDMEKVITHMAAIINQD